MIGLAIVGAIVVGYLVYVVSQTLELPDQLNTAPEKYTYVVAPQGAARQNFATDKKNISAVSVEYLPEKLKGRQFYRPSDRGSEKKFQEFLKPKGKTAGPQKQTNQ